MTVQTPPIRRAPHRADVGILTLGGIALLAVLWTTTTLAMPGLPSMIAIAAAGLAVVIAAIWRRPAQSLAWLPVLIVPPEFAKLFAYEVVLVITIGFVLLIGHLRDWRWAFRLERLEIWVWALTAWAAFTVFWSSDLLWWAFCMRKMVIGGLGLWLAWRLSRLVDPRLMFVGIAATTCALAVATLRVAYVMGWFTSTHVEHMRRTATSLGWGDSNFIAAILAMLLPTAINQAMTGRVKYGRWIGIAAMPLTAMVVTVASSRGGAILTLAIALFMVFRSRIRPWVAFVSAPVVIALMFFGPGAQMLLARFQNAADMLSVVIRLWYWKVAWHRVVDHWPLGMGWGQGFRYPDMLYANDPHDYWLVLGYELGIVGLVLWVVVLFLVYRRIQRIMRNPETRMEGQALQLTFWISQFNTIFEPTFQGLQYHFIWYWIMGAYFGWADRLQDERQADASAAVVPSAGPDRS